MIPENQPPDALYIRWGKFQAGAFGRPAIVALALIVAAFLLRAAGFW
jgi:hypothetical protein